MNSFSLFRRSCRGWRCLAGRTWLEEPVSILRIRTWNFVQVCVKSKLLSLLFLPNSKSIRMIAFRCRWFWGPVWMTPRASPDFSLVGTYLFARCWSLTRYRVLSSDWTFRNYICQSSFDGMWITIDAEFHSSSAGFAVCLCAHLPPNLHPPGALNFALSGTCQQPHESLIWQLPVFNFVQSSLFAFTDRLLPVNFAVSLAPRSSLPFPSPFECRCGEPVGEGERGRPFPLPFWFGSCLNAHASPNEHWPVVIQRMQSPSELFFWHFLSLFLLLSALLLQVCPHETLDESLKSKMAPCSPRILKRSWIIQAMCLPVRDPFSDWALLLSVVKCFLKFLVCIFLSPLAILTSRFSKTSIGFPVIDLEVMR